MAQRLGHVRRRRGSVTKITITSVVVVGLGIAALLITTGRSGGAEGLRSSDLGVIELMDFDITVTASGELEAKNQLEIRNPLSTNSRIAELIDEGEIVAEGDLLIRLDTDNIEQQIRQERLNVITARNDFEQAEANVRLQINENDSVLQEVELQVELVKLALDRWREGEVAKRREQLRITDENAERELSRLEEKLRRTQMLFENEFKSKDELEQVEIRYQQAIADDVIAKLDIEIYEGYQHPEDEKTKLANVEKADAALERAIEQNEINLRNKEATVETRTEQLRIREERLAELEEQFEAATILAPRSGLVVYRTSLGDHRGRGDDPLDVGSDVYPNQTLMILPDTSEMVASVSVHESLAGRVKPNQRARILVEAVDRTFTGTVLSIGVLAETGGWRDPNRREYKVKIALDTQAGMEDLKPSMRCDATIFLDHAQQVLAAPIEAVFSEGPVQFVYVMAGNRVMRKPVRLGKRSDLYAAIDSGLSGGDTVLIREPRPGEIIVDPWDDAELLAAGYQINKDGEPVAPWTRGSAALSAPGMTADRPTGRPANRGTPDTRSGGRPDGGSTANRGSQRAGD